MCNRALLGTDFSRPAPTPGFHTINSRKIKKIELIFPEDSSYIFIRDLKACSAWFNQNNVWNMISSGNFEGECDVTLSEKSVIQIIVNIWSNLTIVINNRIRAKILFPSFLITLNCYSSKNFPFGRVHPPYIKNWSSEKDRKLKSNKSKR